MAFAALPTPADTYVVGFDGSVSSRVALRFAERLAHTTGAEVLAATVASSAGLPPRPEARLAPADQACADAVRQRTIRFSSPARGLRRLARQEGAALLVVGGTHGATDDGVALGDVALDLVRDPPCTVVVVPEPYRDEGRRAVLVAFDPGAGPARTVWAAGDLALGLRATLVAFPLDGPARDRAVLAA